MYYYHVYIIPLSIVFLLQLFSSTGPDVIISYEKTADNTVRYFCNGLKWCLAFTGIECYNINGNYEMLSCPCQVSNGGEAAVVRE
jgi:hypothetical protein